MVDEINPAPETISARPTLDEMGARYVGVGPRKWAYTIDSIASIIIFFIAFKFFGPIKLADISDLSAVPVIEDFLYKVTVVTVIFYFALPECWSKMQASPGKYLMRMRVVNIYGEKIGIIRSLVRNIIKGLSNLVLIPFFTAFIPPKKRAMHDIMSGTYVIYKNKKAK